MIDWKQSAELNGCTIEWLKARFDKYPQSNKIVVAICDECGMVRKSQFNQYRDLCKPCKHGTDDVRKANSERGILRCSDPDEIKRMSDRAIKQWSNPEALKAMSDKKIQFHKDHPEWAEEHSNTMVELWSDPDWANMMSDSATKRWSDPEQGRLLSETLKNSDAHKAASERKRGGNDICNHHYIYDHADLSLYTMPMTRSEHTTMHNRMRADGYEVKHINSETDDNGLWGYR